MKCPNCQTESEGRFCASCGTPLGTAKCPSCGAKASAAARFCARCGHSLRGRAPSTTWPWIIATAAILVAIGALVLPFARRGSSGPVAAPLATGAGSPLDPLGGTPREQADRLFNRIMQERSQGNEEQAKFFVPMAIQAYDMASPLDADGLYHVSLIHSVGGDYGAGRAVAERILQASPTHLLGLAALAEAALGEGDSAAARGAWSRYLENLDAEKAKALTEYLDHAPILGNYEQDAKRLLGR